jgi:hypothetical protein
MKPELATGITDHGDPKSDPTLRKLLEQVAADVTAQKLIEKLRTTRVGLVLSGGGGKGAYEAGVMLALYDCLVRSYVSVAGTSVGGLNAALCHQLCTLKCKNREAVLRIWGDMTNERVMTSLLRAWAVKSLLYVLYSVHLLLNMPNVIRDIVRATSSPELDSLLDVGKKIIALVFGGTLAFMTGALMFIALNVIATDYLGIDFSPGLISGLIGFFAVFLVLPVVCGRIASSIALYDNAPLRASIEKFDIAAICQGSPTVVCTLAERRVVVRMGLPEFAYVPIYVPLAPTMPAEDAVDILVQTAAIPEIFPARYLNGRKFVDGGLADNIPILGTYGSAPQTLIVVYLDHRRARLKELFQSEQFRLNSIVELYGQEWDDKVVTWFQRAAKVEIIPSESLGGTLGVLNFGKAYARRLMKLGYKDTLNRLKRGDFVERTT